MPSIGGYTASVLIEGTPAPEYCVTITTDHTTGQPRATAYIESKSEQDFSVKFEGTNPTSGMHSITAKLTVDAERVVAINAQQPNISLHFLGKPAPGGYKAMAFRVPKLVSDDDVGGAELLAVQREKGVCVNLLR
ncbi:hypothetical protein M427DRAFT_60985 [Gonapodya prolifera JEL478]|uniref:DUF7918 domain-containing protein n=1 Tax=Gonapodya prolifera (strain JEL478) TaxID=1344416 RepID=A0A139A305_GONPJ|nr:hypothetical protein M427DRAFT_60985 [Gonapodya prolifera JEL478]|eukprot:KXS11187.1 hypothetical protein M427DRAFT_60985 [Gonapodya prolifera JEL478]